MHRQSIASPTELELKKLMIGSRRKVFIAAACFLIFSFFMTEAFGATKETSKSSRLLPKVSRSKTTKAKWKATAKPAVNSKAKTTVKSKKKISTKKTSSKTIANTKRKAKSKARPMVSSATRAKTQNITYGLSPDLPDSLKYEIDKLAGLRYQRGGDGGGGVDCSGLVRKVYADAFGINLPRSSTELSRDDSLARVTADELKTGDLLFFGPRRKRVNHVGIYLSGGYFLHSASSEGVTISRLDDGYWKSRWMLSKRVPGLAIGGDSNDSIDHQDLERKLEQTSAKFAFGRDRDASVDRVSFLEGGIKLNDLPEFRLSGYFLHALDNDYRSLGPPSSSNMSTSYDGADTNSGFRLSAVFTPFEWFKLVPSVTQMPGLGEDKNRDGDFQKLGLETWMILPSSRVAVFMAAYAQNQEDLFERPLNYSPDWETLDLALGLHYYFSDSLHFSLLGKHAYKSDLGTSEESGQRNSVLDDVSLQLNLKF